MTPVELSRTVLHAVRRAVDQGELSVAVPARAVVTPPGPGGRGDYATNIALQLARPAGRPARQVAEILRSHLSRTEGVAAVEITGPGFLNIHLDRAAVTSLVREVLDRRDLPYGHSDALAGQVVRLRIPYDIRAEVVADALVRIVASQGGRAEVDHVRPQASEEAEGAERSEASDGVGAWPGDCSRGDEFGEHGDRDDHAGRVGPAARDANDDERDGRAEPIDLRPVPASEDPTPLGPDALRWALLHPAAHDRPRITADLLVQRASNPLFRVRYAHARARALTRNAATLGFTSTPGDLDATAATVQLPGDLHVTPATRMAPGDPDGLATTPGPGDPASAQAPGDLDATPGAVTAPGSYDVTRTPPTTTRTPPVTVPAPTPDLTTPLLTALSEYPHVLLRAATHRTPDRLARHLVVTADALLAFQHTVLPRGDEKPSAAHRARLALAEAAGTVLAGGLSLLGIDAPEYL